MGSQRVNFHSLTYCYELCLFIAVKAFCPEIDFENFVLFCFYLSFSFKPLRQLMRTNIFIPTGTYFVFSICHILLYVCVQSLVHVQCFAMPWTVACQIPLSMGFSRQEYWSALPFSSPGDLPNSGINLCLLHCRLILCHLSQQRSPSCKVAAPSWLPHKNVNPLEQKCSAWCPAHTAGTFKKE